MKKLRILPRFAWLRDRFAKNLGVNNARKEQVYLDIAESVSLTDTSYWIQVLFSAGIATLGLVLNSPAVIIGAMLISPLMGSILANGLALATGDIILALRAILNLLLSCGLAIAFAMLLVLALPFKEMTSEIIARTQPNLLDLVIALFSGAVGAVAICKEPKGIATSIPGVSIAVALMPPLCVVGYGLGMAITVNSANGLGVARGGGLLFLTNLVAITFMAMVVFLALHIDPDPVLAKVRSWRESDPESMRLQSLVDKLPASERVKKIGGLPSRIILIVMTILLVSLPLNQSYNQLRSEVERKQQQNRLRNVATEIWQKNFAEFADGKARSYISQLSLQERERKLTAQLQVVTSKIYTEAERAQYKKLLAVKLLRPVESIALNLIQIPTASSDLLQQVPVATIPSPPPTVAELQSSFLGGIESVAESLVLPAPAQLVNYEVSTSPVAPLKIRVVYLSDREIDRDGIVLLAAEIRKQLNYPTAEVNFQRIAPLNIPLPFGLNQAKITPDLTKLLDRIGLLLQQQPRLQVEITASQTPAETGSIAQDRSMAVSDYLQTKWQIPADRYVIKTEAGAKAIVQLKTIVGLSPNSSLPNPVDRVDEKSNPQ